MNKPEMKIPEPLGEDQIRTLLALAGNERLQGCMVELTNTPDEWEQAIADPAAWLNARGIEIPEGLRPVFNKEISMSNAVDPTVLIRPGPDWYPYEIRLFNCRTYFRPSKDKDGNIVKGLYEKVTVCFGFEIIPHHLPG